jgi:hypothetical protein
MTCRGLWRRKLDSRRSRQRDDSRFAAVVVTLPNSRTKGRERRDVHDRALRPLGHRPCRGLEAHERRIDIHGEDFSPLRTRHLLDCGGGVDPCVVDQDVDCTVRRARSEHRLDRRRVCEIGRHGIPLTESGDRIDRRLGSFAIRPVVDHDTCTSLGKPDGDRPPDAARRPCHQCGPPLQVDRHHGNGQATSYGPASSSTGCQSTC